MDLLRSCYTTRCRFFRDDPTEVAIRWFRAPPGAPFLPIYTRFASGNWAYDRSDWPGVGEVLDAPRTYVNGDTPPTARANHICGPLEWFRDGVPSPSPVPIEYDRFGIPTCCGVGFPLVGDGGMDLDGETPAGLDVGDGGEDLDGVSVVFLDVGDGGEDLDGEAYPGIVAEAGGPEFDGGVSLPLFVGDGGDDFDASTSEELAGDGGDEYDGETAPGVWVGDGGLDHDGAVDVSVFVGDGGGDLDGDVDQVLDVGDGGEDLDGDVDQVLDVGDGGEDLDGDVDQVLDVGDGGEDLDGDVDQVLDVGDGGEDLDGATSAPLFVGDGGEDLDGDALQLVDVGDGGIEGDAQGEAAYGVGDGGDELDGEVIPFSPVTPGTTCAGAATIVLGVPYTFSITFPTFHWFKVAVTSGTQYHLNYSVNSGASAVNCIRGTCPTPTTEPFFARNTTGCSAHTASGSGDLYVQINPSAMGANGYTFSIDTGPC